MSEPLQRLNDDLEDLAALRRHTFAMAESAERIVCEFIKLNPKLADDAIQKLTAWWDKYRPPMSGYVGNTNTHTLMALISAIRGFAAGGS